MASGMGVSDDGGRSLRYSDSQSNYEVGRYPSGIDRLHGDSHYNSSLYDRPDRPSRYNGEDRAFDGPDYRPRRDPRDQFDYHRGDSYNDGIPPKRFRNADPRDRLDFSGLDPYNYPPDFSPRDRPRRNRDYDRNYDRPDMREHRDRSPIPRHEMRLADRYDDRQRYDEEHDRCGENWMANNPTNTIILRGLALGVDELDILKELNSRQVAAKDVRLMRKKSTGMSRGFAFIEFKSVDEACKWMDESKGRISIRGTTAHLYYGSPKMMNERPVDTTDWTCSKCCAHNFKRRDQCYICGLSRGESERAKEGDGFDQIGSNPCNTLIFRGLDALTTDANLRKAIRVAAKKKPKNLKVMTDTLTGTSLCYAFAEFASVKDAKQILDIVQNPEVPFEVDGKLILVAYAKNTFSTVMASVEMASYQNAQWSQQQQQQQHWDYQQRQYYDYYQQPYSQAQSTDKSTNSAAALAQAAIQQAQAAKTSHVTPPDQPSSHAVYPTPDISTYQYDQTSGYYYDPTTGLYYDAQSQYYYNNQTSQFLYWCAEKSTYLPAPTDSGATLGVDPAPAVDDSEDSKKDKEKKEKAKVAKKIAKNMEKWAKSQNNAKHAMKHANDAMPPPAVPVTKVDTRSADAGFSMFEKSKGDSQMMPPPTAKGEQELSAVDPTRLVASYGGDSDDDDGGGGASEDVPVSDESLLDWDKLICQLCKRQFNSQDMLRKHRDLSDLHKQNMAKLVASKGSGKKSDNEKYRDRAAERRQKYGAPVPPDAERRIDFPPPVEISAPAARQSTVANKLMQKMGWSEGQGLGKAAQGIVDPIEAKMRAATAGLGARGASYNVPVGSQYKEAGKAALFARFNELS